MAKHATQPRRQRSFVWLQGLLCGALATLATPTALLLGVLLAPALLAIALDQDAGRPRARSIALFSMPHQWGRCGHFGPRVTVCSQRPHC